MAQQPDSSRDELILEMLREVLARQAEQGRESSGNVRQTDTPPGSSVPSETTAVDSIEVLVRQLEARVDRMNTFLDSIAHPESPPAQPSALQRYELAPAQATPEETRLDAPPGDTLADLEEREDPLSNEEIQQLAEFNDVAKQALEPSRLPRTLALFVAGLLGLLVLIQAPLFGGVPLARALPDRQAFIIRDGLVLKGSGPEIYVLEGFRKRWISSLDAFEHYGYKWDEVHIVDDAFLAQFQDGRPLHVLLKCSTSPHIYRLENAQKRWIKDIPTFGAEGHVWEDVRFVPCDRLRAIANGPPIPLSAGPPPEP